MRKIFFLFILLGLCRVVLGQSFEEKKTFIHKGLLRATATIAPGMLLKQSTSTISIHGNLEYYIADNISIRGDGFYSLFTDIDVSALKFNHSLFAGASYHFKTKNHVDPYIGFEPGISIARIGFRHLNGKIYPLGETTVNPTISPLIGLNIYFQRLFHVFVETRYIYGKHLPTGGYPSQSLSELRFSFGLGFNVDLIKKK